MKRILISGIILTLILTGISCSGSESLSDNGTSPDITPPSITNVLPTDITETSATITWTTDEPATSQVEYGVTSDYGTATSLDEDLVTSHSVNLGGLTSGITYHYRVKSRDASGNENISADSSFSTHTAPTEPPDQSSCVSPAQGAMDVELMPTLVSSSFSDPDIGDTHAASQWQITTTSGDYSSPVFDSGTDNSNLTQITMPSGTLSYNTTYYWRVRHQDNHSAWSEWSVEASFTTLHGEAPPDPYFPDLGYGEGYDYSFGGLIIGVSVEKELENRGGPGEIFLSVRGKTRENLFASKVFHMDEGERVVIHAYFGGSFGHYFIETFTFVAREALSGDVSEGEISLIRSTMKAAGHLNVGNVKDVAVSGNFAYVISEERWPYDPNTAFMADISLRVIDMSNKSDPVEVSHLDFEAANTAFSRYGVRVVGDYVYVAIGHYDEHSDNGLHIIDVSNPSNPFRIGKYCWEGGFYDLEVSDDFAYACTPDKRTLAGGSLCVIDISTPAKPLSVGRLEFNRDPVHISVKDNYAYITYDFGRKMSVIDISMPNSPTEVADWTYTSNQGGEDCITISSNYAYMGSVTGSLFIVDVGIPSEPTMLGEYRLADLLGSVTDVAVSGNYAYLAHRFGLSAIDISNPSMPTEAGSFTDMHKVGNCVVVAGGYYFLGGSSGLYILRCLN